MIKYFLGVILFILSCNYQVVEPLKLSETFDRRDTFRFKEWLIDTLPILQSNISDNSQINIDSDSLTINIYSVFDTIINSKVTYKDPNLILALKLIKDNNELTSSKIRLLFNCVESYTLSPIDRHNYEFQYEIQKFTLFTNNKTIEYNYSKGNLLSRLVY
jgi:hypothetical protein